MKKVVLVFLALVLLLSGAAIGGRASSASAREPKILEFDTMIGVPRPYTGGTNAIRGVPGGGLPWVIGSAHGELKQNGKVEIKVNGLVFDPSDPAVQERGLGGTNNQPEFKAIISCLSKNEAGEPITVNVPTKTAPADAAGNSLIEDVVELPSPCIAPIIFVTSTGGSWFAATGK